MYHKIAHLGLFTAAAILLGYIESLIPFFAGIPGMKLGLSNLMIVFILYLYSWREAVSVSVIRVFVIGFLFGNLFSIAFSMGGALFSIIIMTIFSKIKGFSVLGVSIAGGCAHNIAQVIVAAFVMHSFMIIPYYLPVLLVSGVVTGLLIGLVSREMIKRLKPIFIQNREHI